MKVYGFRWRCDPKVRINKTPALVRIMAWCWPSHYLNQWWLFFFTHICVTRPQWVKLLWNIALIHWGRVTHICIGNIAIIDSDNGLSPGGHKAIISTNAVLLSIGPLGTNFSEISMKSLIFSSKKMYLKIASAKWRPYCRGLNVLKWRVWGALTWMQPVDGGAVFWTESHVLR